MMVGVPVARIVGGRLLSAELATLKRDDANGHHGHERGPAPESSKKMVLHSTGSLERSQTLRINSRTCSLEEL